MSHDATNAPAAIDGDTARLVAETMQALATPSRVLILGHLRTSPLTVGDLARAVEMDPSAVSHQLRVLRHLGLVVAERTGRTAIYSLHDEHVAELVDQAVHHITHRRLGLGSHAS
ncbi:MAG: ArsR family transcriptional regulator [Thermoleophilia bacterium]|nr:ArsR family transcriptional regulator [Thermoleophilia bacterium]MCZ4496706.1 ArsR family transcriptional regulator [Thermoleophilia bacterium]